MQLYACAGTILCSYAFARLYMHNCTHLRRSPNQTDWLVPLYPCACTIAYPCTFVPLCPCACTIAHSCACVLLRIRACTILYSYALVRLRMH